MNPQAKFIIPDNEAHWLDMRKDDITSTEIAALFGLSPYTTIFELWHHKKARTSPDFDPNQRMVWGNRLQDAIALGAAADFGWKVRKATEYGRIPELRIGSSFDFMIVEGDHDESILEIKNVDSLQFRDGWIVEDDGYVEAPPHIELQVQQQMLITGLKSANIIALVGGNDIKQVFREADPEIHAAIKERVAAFWAGIEANIEPEPDFEKDAEFLRKIYSVATPDKVFDAKGNARIKSLVTLDKTLAEGIKNAEAQRAAGKAEMLTIIGDCDKVVGEGFTISTGMIGPAQMNFTREGYRNFRVNWPRGKKNG